jgi:5-(carboxyamino)imidazole ribonucleotide synthase
LVVVALIAVATAGVSLSLRDSADSALERDAERLAALLETGRAQARAHGMPVVWQTAISGTGFEFAGLPPPGLPRTWLNSNTRAAPGVRVVLGPEPLIAEKWIEYQAEVSVLVARNPSGQVEAYPMFTNRHSNHILDITSVPASGELARVETKAVAIACAIAESLGLEGLICVEMFVDRDGVLMVNELAPRPHNSGHLTMEASAVSQFEQQVRAVCNLPLGAVSECRPAAMVNLLGDLWSDGQAPDWSAALSQQNAHLHLYGKTQARVGRKMGHLTVLGQTPQAAIESALQLRGRWARISESRG